MKCVCLFERFRMISWLLGGSFRFMTYHSVLLRRLPGIDLLMGEPHFYIRNIDIIKYFSGPGCGIYLVLESFLGGLLAGSRSGDAFICIY